MLKKNTVWEVEIYDISGDGNGIAKIDGEIIFVPYTAIGDIVSITIIKVAKNYAVGKVNEIIVPSKARCLPDCSAFGKCGGCVFRHLDLTEEERIKTQSVENAMKRIGHLDVDVKKCVTPSGKYYRNKAQLPVSQDKNGLHCGFYAPHSHRIVDGSLDCSTSPTVFSDISRFILNFMKEQNISGYCEESKIGIVRHFYFRINANKQIMVCIVTSTKSLVDKNTEDNLVKELTSNFPQIVSVFLNYNPDNTNVILGPEFRLLWGAEYFEDEILGTKLLMSPDSFFQVNREGAEKIYSTAFSLLDGYYENVYDLYCGIGSIGITLFNQINTKKINVSAKRLFGIEIVEKAVLCAKQNAKINNVTNASFCACDSDDITKMDWFDSYAPSLVILDPPRKGTTVKLLDFLIEKDVENILYISCDPATLARDMSHLVSNGYSSSSVHPINLFSGTKHVECCVLLKKRK